MPNDPNPPTYVVATDGSNLADAAIDRAAQMAKRTGASLTIVTVEPLVPAELDFAGMGRAPAPATVQLLDQGSDEVLELAKSRALRQGVAAATIKFPPQDPARAIADYAKSVKADMIFVGSHGRTGIRRILLGSVAERVVRLAHSSVVVVR